MAEFMLVPSGGLTPGQRVTLTVTGIAVDTSSIKINTVAVGKKSKMNTQEILLSQMNSRLENIDKKTSGQSTRV
jgi:hypothetical protein